ncbi:MAG TPA: hypothetical protein V6C72_02610 [Chroococcales cyanobacterium]
MNLPTVVVCDDSAKRNTIEELVRNQAPLVFLTTMSRQTMQTQTLEDGVKVIWIELSPSPQQGLKMLADLKEKYPRTHFLVSYAEMKPDLVKTVMQLGAVEYLDDQSLSDLLEPAVARIVGKEETAAVEVAAKPAAVVVEESMIMAERGPNTPRPTNSMRSKLTTPNLNPNDPLNSLPPWLLPTILVVMILATVLILVVKH